MHRERVTRSSSARGLLVGLVLVVVAGLGAVTPASAGPSPTSRPTPPVAATSAVDLLDRLPVDPRRSELGTTLRKLQRRMLTVVNLARAVPQTCGGTLLPAVKPVRTNKRVSRAAQRYARKMARKDWFAHDAPDGTDPGERIRAEGYRWSRWGENIAAGYDGVGQVVAAWLDSPGHCRTLMGSFRHVGFGHAYAKGSTYGHYWVQDFASPK